MPCCPPMRRGVVIRVVGVVAALVVCAWFALGVHQGADTDAATAILGGGGRPLAPAQARHAAALLNAAATLNPDRGVDLLRSALALRQGDRARAQAIALAVTRSEPQNLQAWLAYAAASVHDLPRFAVAVRHLDALAPAVRSSGA